jgi:3-methyladenine DNA glycosylase AlkC
MQSPKRKGSRRIADIPYDILQQINHGEIETANLMESLAIDFVTLLQSALPDISHSAIQSMRDAKDKGWIERSRLAARLIYDQYGLDIVPSLLSHKSDNVRGWVAGVVACAPSLGLSERLDKIKPLADDSNAGTREMAWLFLRGHIAADIEHAIQILTPWTVHESANIRRFAIESTRPRGVWCAHIVILKQNPTLGLPLLINVRSDPARYVQDAVANWLNDAAKSKPDWVQSIIADWQSQSWVSDYTAKRSLRNLK